MSNYNRQPVAPVIMVAAGVVLILGAIFWSMNMGQNLQANDVPPTTGVLLPSTAPASIPLGEATPAANRIPFPNVPRVSVADAKAALDAGEAMFVDTRGEPYFSGEHIPGAIPLTADEVAARLSELDPDEWIITYCT